MNLAKKMEKNPSVSVTQNVTVARPQANSRVVNQLTNALNAPKPTAATSLLATVTMIQAQQPAGRNSPRAIPISPQVTAAIQALAKGGYQTPSSVGQSQTSPQIISPRQSSSGCPPIRNLNLKIINPAKKSEYETYILRNIESSQISTPMALKKEIFTQLGNEYVSSKLDFAVGYMKSGTKLWIRTGSDVHDLWNFVHRGENISLWCNGRFARNRVSSESDSDDASPPSAKKPRRKKRKKVSALDEKNNRVEEIVTNLREKHGSLYTSIQYRLWAEMVDVGTHKSQDDPPRVPVFTGGREKRPSQVQVLTSAVSEIARAIGGASTPASSSASIPSCSTGFSLFESGAITEIEFQEQKIPILEQLKKLSSC